MNRPKAIEILDLNLKEAGKSMPPDCREAIRVAVRSMKELEVNKKRSKN